jgi:ketosteroid isomerase-like protein
MPEQPTTPDRLELTRRQIAAINRRDMDAFMSRCPPDGVYDTGADGLGVFEGRAAIRGFLEDYWGAFEDLRFELEEVVDLGNGVTFSAVRQEARPAGSTGHVPRREAHRGIEAIRQQVARWVEAYPDLRVEPLETRSNVDKVFVWVRFIGHGAASGVPIDMELAHVCTVRNGKTVRLVEYSNRADALEAVELAE